MNPSAAFGSSKPADGLLDRLRSDHQRLVDHRRRLARLDRTVATRDDLIDELGGIRYLLALRVGHDDQDLWRRGVEPFDEAVGDRRRRGAVEHLVGERELGVGGGDRVVEQQMVDVALGEVPVLSRVTSFVLGLRGRAHRLDGAIDLVGREAEPAHSFELVEHRLRRCLEVGAVAGDVDLGCVEALDDRTRIGVGIVERCIAAQRIVAEPRGDDLERQLVEDLPLLRRLGDTGRSPPAGHQSASRPASPRRGAG